MAHEELGSVSPETSQIEAALHAAEEESRLPRKTLFKNYWPAIVYSSLLSLALVMEGMDLGMLNNLFGHPAFVQNFGELQSDGKYRIATRWQGAVSGANQAGSVVGLLLNGWLQSRYGSRKVYMGAMVLMAGTIFILFFATSIEMLVIGNVFCGIPWGIFQTLSTAYAAEICPAAMRGYLTAWVSMCWGMGSFLAQAVLRGSLGLQGNWGWKVPYALQWVWIPPLLVVGFLCPESPWYLVRRGRIDDAEKSLRRLAKKGHYTEETMAQTLALMKHTNEMEKVDSADASYQDCFRGTNLRRTLIVCAVWWIQCFNGQALTGYAAQFLQAAGMSVTMSFNYSMAIQSVNILATGIAISLMGHVGRRWFYVIGSNGIGLWMAVIGILGALKQTTATATAVAAMLILTNFTFKVSLGPACFVIAGEMSSSRVRAQTIVLGRSTYIIGALINNQLTPRMVSQADDAWGWGMLAGWFYFGCCVIYAVWLWFKLPETKNRSFAELEYLFQKKVPARKFAKHPVDVFENISAEASMGDKDRQQYKKAVAEAEEKREI
ncbi:alpha-glucosides permease MPH2/3 [Plectosphaerella cucumerina]|uniref:Alpha-glucosides permease MPH2/3 n=1 Tax=Plectosphaerella cucumerina TaxID=40658 RepID=A0A8K0TMV8_9PEZI|nr:alpha-glucosides permease MPH2/3 [Plectosphaerella cucumerina]